MLKITSSDFKKIWWVASYPKSGNTWVKLFLEAYTTGMPVELNTVYGRFVLPDNAPHFYQSVCPWPVTTAYEILWAALRVPALLQMIASRGCIELALKTHHANVSVEGLKLIPPMLTKGAVYIIRDPRDIVVSASHHSSITIDQAIDHLNDSTAMIANTDTGMGHLLQSWSDHVLSWTVGNDEVDTVVVRYEDILADPMAALTGILLSLGFKNLSGDRLEFAVRETNFENLQAKEDKHGFVEQKGSERFFRQGKINGWMSVLNKGQVKRIEDTHGEVMSMFGYKTQE